MSKVRRFFIEFSYNGARFSGVAKQLNAKTVHNVIEENMKKELKNSHELKSNICISSRTDAGVHAIANTAHFDLIESKAESDQCIDICNLIKNSLNRNFIENKILIRILKCQEVDQNFISRHAKSRTYFYRLGLLKNGLKYWKEIDTIRKIEKHLHGNSLNFSIPYLYPLSNYLTFLDFDCVTELKEPFDKDLFFKAINIFNGTYDFSAFTTNKGRDEITSRNKNPIKTVEIKKYEAKSQFLSEYLHNYNEKYDIIELEIKCSSFFYKMIRKMVGAANDVATGLIPIDQINQMLNEPKLYYTDKLTSVMKPNGLFLKKVEYDEDCFKLKK